MPMHWIKVADHVDTLLFNAEQIAVVTVAGQPYCIGRFKEQLFGFAYRCPHAAVPLSDGYIDTPWKCGVPAPLL